MATQTQIIADDPAVKADRGTGVVRRFLDHHFLHFNSREVLAAARAYESHLDTGGRMMVTLGGAMSTAKIGRTLSRMIRQDKVHAITCTGANLEEDLFSLLAADDYELCPEWRTLSPADEQALRDRGMNRVTDTCIPEMAMRQLEGCLLERWTAACQADDCRMPYEFFYDILHDGQLEPLDPARAEESWMIAAVEKDIPIYVPGWEDSSTGNFFTASVLRGLILHHRCVKTGTEQMEHLVRWYLNHCNQGTDKSGVGFFQIGGGIAGDFPICAVPLIIQDLKRTDTPFWDYFCQISDAVTSYGGYSGAVPNEKITWGKLDVDTPRFMIQSDATIVVPLIFAYVLGD